MILSLGTRTMAAAGLMLPALPAYADVLQIDGQGAHWVTPAAPSSVAALSNVSEAHSVPVGTAGPTDVPDSAVGDPAADAANVPQAYRARVADLAARYDLSPALIEALVWQESRWRPGAVSSAGARGLAQLMPGTAQQMGVNPDDPDANLEGGARYLRIQLNRFGGDLEKALAAYNAGPGRVERAGGIPAIRETQSYVAAIMGRLANHSRE